MSEDLQHRLDRLESLVERQAERIDDQQETIERQRERIGKLEEGRAPGDGDAVLPSTTRRSALKAGGLLALLGVGAGTAAADPQGQVGTEDDPIETLYTEALNGGLTGDTAVTSLAGAGLTTGGNELGIADDGVTATQIDLSTLAGPGIEVRDGELWVPSSVSAPSDLNAVLDEMAGDGSSGSPYQITDVRELQAMNADPAANYELASDINASPTTDWNDGSGFDPIGDSSNPFTETFDGNGRTITGLTIKRSGEDYVGLFGIADSGAIIENVGLEAVDVSGTENVGGLVGFKPEGVVERSYATGSVSGSNNVGGLVGFNEIGPVSTSYATGSVSGDSSVGGLIGHNEPGVVERSYATGSVSGDSGVGGLTGDGSFTEVSSSYWDVPATGEDSSEGGTGVGSLSDDPPAEGMVGDELNDGLESDFDFTDVWETVDAENDSDVSEDDYPVLRALDRAAQLAARE